MEKIISKSSLAIILSKLKGFQEAKVRDEQYLTDSEAASDILEKAFLLKDIKNKTILDLGCGTGILGFGALIKGAKRAIMIDKDPDAIKIAEDNKQILLNYGYKNLKNAILINSDIKDICNCCSYLPIIDTIIQNPPFGIKKAHSDKLFLEKAMELSPIIYSLHKSESTSFIKALAKEKNYKITHIWPIRYPLKAQYSYHTRRIKYINLSWYRLKNENKK